MNLFLLAQEKIVSNYDLTQDLSNYLRGFLSHYNLKYSFGDQELYLSEVVMPVGGLSLFLFNKQDIIENYTKNKKNSDGQDLKINILFIEESTDTYFGFYPKIEHNLIGTNPYHTNSDLYYNFMHYLAKHILQDKELLFQNDKILLDSLFDKLTQHIKTIKVCTNNNDEKQKPSLKDTVEDEQKPKKQFVEDSTLRSFKIRRKISKKTNKNNN